MSGIAICGGAVAYRRHILRCWGRCDGRRRRVVSSWPASPFYGPVFTCCHCGDQWSDGELLERPFARGWRAKNIARAKQVWRESIAGPVRVDEDFYVVPDGGAA